MSPCLKFPNQPFQILPNFRFMHPAAHTTSFCLDVGWGSVFIIYCCITNTPKLSDPKERLIISHDSVGPDSLTWAVLPLHGLWAGATPGLHSSETSTSTGTWKKAFLPCLVGSHCHLRTSPVGSLGFLSAW